MLSLEDLLMSLKNDDRSGNIFNYYPWRLVVSDLLLSSVSCARTSLFPSAPQFLTWKLSIQTSNLIQRQLVMFLVLFRAHHPTTSSRPLILVRKDHLTFIREEVNIASLWILQESFRKTIWAVLILLWTSRELTNQKVISLGLIIPHKEVLRS